MPKKSTQWITIPENTLHTPVSGAAKPAEKAKPGSSDLVRNKFFWGIGFVVLLVAAFAVLAPAQFSGLLKGSLFDTTGVPPSQTSGVINPVNLLPTEDQKKQTSPAATEEKKADTTAQATTGAAAPTTNGAAPAATPVVQPQAQAVPVAVQPLAQTESAAAATPATPATPKDCANDMTCFLPHLADCTLAKAVFDMTIAGQSIESNVEITGVTGDDCGLSISVTKAPLATLVGASATCKLTTGAYTQDSLQAIFADADTLAKTCGGTAVDGLKGVLAQSGSQAQVVDQLKKQVEDLQNQKDQSTKMLQDLVTMVQSQKQAETTHAAAPTSVTATNALSQGVPQQAGYRTNPYRVTVTPEQMLQQSAAGGTAPVAQTYYQGATYQGTTYQQSVYQAPLIKGKRVPQTGPEEIAIALAVGFMALVGWKFMRTFAT
jgi:cytoskeletal protein RodZ